MELRRATYEEIPEAKIWDLEACWEAESSQIDRYIRGRAIDALKKKWSNWEEAKLSADDVWNNVDTKFSAESAPDADLLSDAGAGVFKRQAGNSSLINTFKIAALLTAGAEVALFVGMIVMGLATPVVLLQGLILAVGSLVLGWGVGQLVIGRDVRWAVFFSLIGVIAVGVILVIRYMAEVSSGMTVVLISLALVLIVVTTEALYLRGKEAWDVARDAMFRAQRMYADEQHSRIRQTGGERWKKRYVTILEEEAPRLRSTLSPKHAGDESSAYPQEELEG